MKKRSIKTIAGCLAFALGLTVFSSTANAFTKGTVDGDVYTNESLGLSFDASGSNLSIFNEDQLAQLMNLTTEKMSSDEDLSELLEAGQPVIDFCANDNDNGASVNINVQNSDASDMAPYLVTGTDALVDYVIKMYQDQGYDQALYSSAGIQDGSLAKDKVTFLGKETPCVLIQGTISANGQDIPVYERIFYSLSDTALSTITVCTYMEDNTQDYIDRFSEI